MQQTGLPSKKFLIRGGIAIGIVAIILIVQTQWFLALFNKKPRPIDPNLTIGGAVAKDSNGNGIPDWEERLWGLDPTELYTGDMSNREIIENKKRALGLTVEGDEELNETDRLARQLFSIGSSLGQEGASLTNIGSAGEALGQSVEVQTVTDNYYFADLKTTPTTRSSVTSYQKRLTTTIGKYKSNDINLKIVLSALETGDYSKLPQLKQTAITYRALAQELSSMTAPIGVAQYHLDMMNGFYGQATAFDLLAQLDENGIVGLNGLAIYKEYSVKLDSALFDINQYIIEYGILTE